MSDLALNNNHFIVKKNKLNDEFTTNILKNSHDKFNGDILTSKNDLMIYKNKIIFTYDISNSFFSEKNLIIQNRKNEELFFSKITKSDENNFFATIDPSIITNDIKKDLIHDLNLEMSDSMNSRRYRYIKNIKMSENFLFYLGISLGLFVISVPLYSNVPFFLALGSSLLGFGATIPKLRREIDGK